MNSTETQTIDLVITHLTALKAAIAKKDAFEQYRQRYMACWAFEELIQDDSLASAKDSDATFLDREFGWDVVENIPARDEPISTAQVERVFPRAA